MKRAKIMLSALAVVAIVGGALAFKANKGTLNFCVLSTSETPGDICTAKFQGSRQIGTNKYFTAPIPVNGVCGDVTCTDPSIALGAE